MGLPLQEKFASLSPCCKEMDAEKKKREADSIVINFSQNHS